jgi:hypothetical protein
MDITSPLEPLLAALRYARHWRFSHADLMDWIAKAYRLSPEERV